MTNQTKIIFRIDVSKNKLDVYCKDSNEHAIERIIRNVKVKTRVSGFFKSFEGVQRFAVIRSVIDTILKNNQNLFDIFEQIHATNFD